VPSRSACKLTEPSRSFTTTITSHAGMRNAVAAIGVEACGRRRKPTADCAGEIIGRHDGNRGKGSSNQALLTHRRQATTTPRGECPELNYKFWIGDLRPSPCCEQQVHDRFATRWPGKWCPAPARVARIADPACSEGVALHDRYDPGTGGRLVKRHRSGRRQGSAPRLPGTIERKINQHIAGNRRQVPVPPPKIFIRWRLEA
jgi:hypothetical protein